MNHVFYISDGLLTPEHMGRIDSALWEFLWFISHETREEGKVLNGSPITVRRIAEELGESRRTAIRHLDRLEAEGYITRVREHSGAIYSYRIANSKKWAHGRNATREPVTELSPGDDMNDTGAVTRMASGVAKNVTANKECRQVDIVDRIDKNAAPKNGAAHPTLQEVILYCQERGNTVKPQQWMDYYQSNGWRVGRNAMKDWRAAVRTWENNHLTKGTDHGNRAEQTQSQTVQAIRDAKAAVARETDPGMVH